MRSPNWEISWASHRKKKFLFLRLSRNLPISFFEKSFYYITSNGFGEATYLLPPALRGRSSRMRLDIPLTSEDFLIFGIFFLNVGTTDHQGRCLFVLTLRLFQNNGPPLEVCLALHKSRPN